MKPFACGAQSGFTLIETIVAFAVLALALGVLYESFGWSLRRNAVIAGREAAWLTAQSVLAQVRASAWLRPGERNGVSAQGLQWSSVVRPYAASVSEHNAVQAFEVTVDVSWGQGPARKVQLRSIEVGRTPS